MTDPEDADMAEMVRKNIQEVLDICEAEQPGQAHSTTLTGPCDVPAAFQRCAPPGLRPTHSSSGKLGGRSAQPDSRPGDSGRPSLIDLPQNAEGTIRLHKARVKGLEKQVAELSCSLREKEQQHAESMKELKALQNEKANWAKMQKSLESQVEKQRKEVALLKDQLAAKDIQVKEINKDGTVLEKQKKAAEVELQAHQARLQRAMEEVERCRSMLRDVQVQEKEGKDMVKADVSKLVADNKKLERQKAELILAFKKQLKLIDVLRRQKVHLEAARALSFSEDEFMKVLDTGGS